MNFSLHICSTKIMRILFVRVWQEADTRQDSVNPSILVGVMFGLGKWSDSSADLPLREGERRKVVRKILDFQER